MKFKKKIISTGQINIFYQVPQLATDVNNNG